MLVWYRWYLVWILNREIGTPGDLWGWRRWCTLPDAMAQEGEVAASMTQRPHKCGSRGI